MIKNLLYSLFLHFLLLLLLYANFNLKNNNENKSSEIAVSLISLAGSEDFSKSDLADKKTQPEKKSKKPSAKEALSQKHSSKNKVADAPKELSEAKPTQSVAKPITNVATPELKAPEKIAEKQEENTKNKQDPQVTKNEDERKIDVTKKDQDIGAEKQSTEKQESDTHKNTDSATAASSANNLENIDLSVREKFNIQSQLKRCYSRAVTEGNSSATKSKVTITVKINEDGVIDSDIDDIVEMERYNDPKDPNYKIIIDNSRRALELCSPLRNLPVEKYEIWKKVTLEFGDTN